MGVWDPAKFEVEDAAFGFVTMKMDIINIKSSWALNIIDNSGMVTSGTKADLIRPERVSG